MKIYNGILAAVLAVSVSASAESLGQLKLTDLQVERSGIERATAKSESLRVTLSGYGQVAFNDYKTSHVLSQAGGVAKRINVVEGDRVQAGDVLAVLESRDLADARVRYLSAVEKEQMHRAFLKREEGLRKKKISAERDYLEQENQLLEAVNELRLAKQRLLSFGVSEEALEDTGTDLARYEIKAPISGTVVRRAISTGELVAEDGTAFLIADLSSLWVEAAVHIDQAMLAREGQRVRIGSEVTETEVEGTVAFVSPVVDAASKTVPVRVTIPNKNGRWRPGQFVTAEVIIEDDAFSVVITQEAVLDINGATVVFVATGGNTFEARNVELGRRDGGRVEVRRGIDAGESYVAGNGFVLKAHLLGEEG